MRPEFLQTLALYKLFTYLLTYCVVTASKPIFDFPRTTGNSCRSSFCIFTFTVDVDRQSNREGNWAGDSTVAEQLV